MHAKMDNTDSGNNHQTVKMDTGIVKMTAEDGKNGRRSRKIPSFSFNAVIYLSWATHSFG